jgi:hypothetical protein
MAMGGRGFFLSGVCVLAAVSAGCVGSRADQDSPLFYIPRPTGWRDKSARQTLDNTVPPIASPVAGTAPGATTAGQPTNPGQAPPGVQPAGLSGAARPGGVVPAGMADVAQPLPVLPPPTPVPGSPSSPPGVPPTPGTPGVPTVTGAPYGPHSRVAPTVAGGLLNLGPNEIPTDRVVELAKMIEAAGIENRALLNRIRDLEATAVGREQAIAETLRDVEAASAEVARSKAEVETLRKDIATLRDRLELVEKEDVETLRLVIEALEKLLETPRVPPGRVLP